MAHLLKYDSNLGPLDGDVEVGDGVIRAGGEELKLLSERDPGAIPWGELGVDVVLESTGFFTKRDGAQKHLDAGAKKVVISAPATDPDITLVLGVNDDAYDKDSHHIVSNASCTTNCIAPMAKVLHDAFMIEQGFMTTIHAYTDDQRILDMPHKDLRRARAAAINLIPTSTGAARAIGLVLPELKGKVDGDRRARAGADGLGHRLRRPLGRETIGDEVNAAFKEAAGGPLEGILQYSEDPLVSTDIIHSPYSCIFDSELTMVNGTERQGLRLVRQRVGLLVPPRRPDGQAALMRFSQVRLLVDDFGAAFRFYRDTLGLTAASGDETSGYASFDTGTGSVAIFERAGQGERRRAASARRLDPDRPRGGRCRRGRREVARARCRRPGRPAGVGRAVAYLRDPSGNLLELFQVLQTAE